MRVFIFLFFFQIEDGTAIVAQDKLRLSTAKDGFISHSPQRQSGGDINTVCL